MTTIVEGQQAVAARPESPRFVPTGSALPIVRSNSATSYESISNRNRYDSEKSVMSDIVIDPEKEELPVDLSLPIKKLMSANKKEWHFILLGTLGAVLQGCVMPIYGIMFGDIMYTLSKPADEAEKESIFYAYIFVAIGVTSGLAAFSQSYFFALSGERLTARLRRLSFAAILRQEISWFDEDDNSVGALCSTLSGDASAVQGATGSRLGVVGQSVTAVVVGFAVGLYFEWRLALLCVPFIPLVMGSTWLQAKMLVGQALSETKTLQRAGKIAIESITNIRTVASLQREDACADAYAAALLEPHKIALRNSHLRGIAFGLAQALPWSSYAVVIAVGAKLVEDDNVPYQNIFKVAEAMVVGTMLVAQTVAFSPNMNKGQVAASRIFKLLDRQPAIDSDDATGKRMNENVDKISSEDVYFRYPTRKDTPILNGLTLQINRGETLALVGASGCGKSTLIQLLLRFYDADKGKLLINTDEVRDLRVSSLRDSFGLVSQEPVLFDVSLEENIAYGDNSRLVSRQEVEAAARQANIHEFISGLPGGYRTRVGYRGGQLSGGQKQRIAIARALVGRPEVLLLDEATSALDTESEAVVQQALDSASQGVTTITIAHRLSTIRNAHKIAVIERGRLAECGTHDQLLALQGAYYDLCQRMC